MIRRIFLVYGIELTKASRQRLPIFGLLAMMAATGATYLANPFSADGLSDYAFIAYATPVTMNLLGLIILLAFSANLVSSDLGSGVIRTILVRPIRRHELLLAKLFLGMTYALLLAVFASFTAWGALLLFGDTGGVRYGAELVYSDSEMRSAFFIALGLNIITLFAAVSYGLFISTCTRNPAAAVTVTIGLWILIDIVKYPLRVSPYVFTTYLETPWSVYADHCDAIAITWEPTAYPLIATAGTSFILFVIASLVVIARKNFSA